MEKLGMMWLDAETLKKHEVVIAPEFAHLLDDATGAPRNHHPTKVRKPFLV
jgi:hypothetical protein